MTSRVASYGAWPSLVTADLLASSSKKLGQLSLAGDDIVWVEGRPGEGGRYVVVRRSEGGDTYDLTPSGINVRTAVHEYGGRAYALFGDSVVFSNHADHRLHVIDRPGAEPRPLTPSVRARYADPVHDPRGRLVCVREDHTGGMEEPTNSLVAVELDTGRVRTLAQGRHFYSSPALSPDGAHLCWLEWDHPNMPWDGTELKVAPVTEDGDLGPAVLVAGGADESVFQPQWSPGGTLGFVSDRTGFWNLYQHRDGRVVPLCPMEAEFGVPQWVFGMSTWAYESERRVVCAFATQGRWRLATLDLDTGALVDTQVPYTEIGSVRASAGRACFIGGSASRPLSVVSLDLGTGRCDVLARASDVEVDERCVSEPEHIAFPTTDGATAHALYYAPRNKDFRGPDTERPPLVVKSHGGPTASASTALDLEIQFWTSRGFAVLDVDYRGSTGYGRAYRRALEGHWGVRDVDDCVNGALFLAARGVVDGARLCIEGGSAGGFTTLSALTFRDTFAVGASYYGVSDLEAFARDTHKFESRYLDGLVGPYPARRDLYEERSPIRHVDRLARPVIFFQGLEDAVVPPNQTERMVDALRERGVPVAYLPFPGEQHGFRRSENIKRSLEAQLAFFARVLGFEQHDSIEPPLIENASSIAGLPERRSA